MIPLLVLGIPSIPATAILLSALIIHGIEPGPQMIEERPEIFWGLIASMYIGNVILLILNVPLVGIFVSLLRIPYAWLAPIVVLASIVGVYSVNASAVEIWLMIVFGLIGYVLRKFRFDVAPLPPRGGARRPHGARLPPLAHHLGRGLLHLHRGHRLARLARRGGAARGIAGARVVSRVPPQVIGERRCLMIRYDSSS